MTTDSRRTWQPRTIQLLGVLVGAIVLLALVSCGGNGASASGGASATSGPKVGTVLQTFKNGVDTLVTTPTFDVPDTWTLQYSCVLYQYPQEHGFTSAQATITVIGADSSFGQVTANCGTTAMTGSTVYHQGGSVSLKIESPLASVTVTVVAGG